MLKGKYIIEKYAGELVDGEWVKKELIEVTEHKNAIAPELMYKYWTDIGSEANASETIIAASELKLYKPLNIYPAGTNWYRAIVPEQNAVYFPPAGGNDAYFEFVSVINPDGGSPPRNLRSLCLTTIDSSDTTECYSVTALASPCVQAPTEILQITYRVTLDTASIVALSDISEKQALDRFRNGVFGGGNDSAYYGSLEYVLTWDRSLWGTGLIESLDRTVIDDNEFQQSSSSSFSYGSRKYTLTNRYGEGNSPSANGRFCGMPWKGVSTGRTSHFHIATLDKGTVSCVQNTFGKTAPDGTQRAPFLDNTYIGGAAACNLQDRGDWVDHIPDSYNMPYLYRIYITTGGATGAATYRFRRTRLGRLHENLTYCEPAGIGIPTMDYRSANSVAFSTIDDTDTVGRHGQAVWVRQSDSDNSRPAYANRTQDGDAKTIHQRYMETEILCFDYTGVTIHKTTGPFVNFDANSTPALNVTDVKQCSTDGTTIYVADAATGLYQIQREFGDYTDSNATITQLSPPGIDATSCRGVHCGYEWQEGSVVNIRVQFGGSNYAVNDTVTITGANGSGATAVVQTVDADGAITSVKVTDGGSGYINEAIQAYVSTGNGVGANLQPEVGSDMEMWALFNDTTASVMYLAHGTKVATSGVTNLNFDTTADTITRTGGSWVTDGFRAGQKLFIKHAQDAGNNGVFTIATVDSATQITVSENLTTNSTDTDAVVTALSWELMRETVTTGSVSFTYNENSPSADTITRASGSFITDGFVQGMKIVVSGTSLNDGVYTIADVAALTLTLDDNDDLAAETFSSTITSEVDFTITNYTSGTPGRNNMIGLMWDREHVDNRFLMLTPATVIVNDGLSGTNSSSNGFNWWSYGASKIASASFDTSTGVNGTTEVITTDAAHGFAAGHEVTYSKDGGSAAIGLTDATQYFVNPITSTTLSLHTTRADAINDTSPVNLTAAASETHLLTADQGTDTVRSNNTTYWGGLAGEHIGTQLAAPLTSDNLWVFNSSDAQDGIAARFGIATWLNDDNTGYTAAGRAANNIVRDKTAFQTGVLGYSSVSLERCVWRLDSTQFDTPGTTYEGVICSNISDRAELYAPSYQTNGHIWNYLGHGLATGIKSGTPAGNFVYSVIGDAKPENVEGLPYGVWDEFGWDGTRWVLGNTSSRTCHAEASFVGTNININHTAGTIVGTFTGTDWAGDGFEVGDTITITGAADAGNNGSYVIESLSGTTLTITPWSNTLTTTNATNGSAQVVGSRALIDGLSLSFDTAGADLILNEYYDVHLFDGILCDNATTASADFLFIESGTETGTTYTSSTIPSVDAGVVTDLYSSCSVGSNLYTTWWYEGPGRACTGNQIVTTNLNYGEQNLGTGDFTITWRQSGSAVGLDGRLGIVPWTDISTQGTVGYANMDWCVSANVDQTVGPSYDIYDFNVWSTGNDTGANFTMATDRIVTDSTQTHVDFTGDAGEGTVIAAGDGGGGNAYVVNDVITMDDGTTVTVDAIDGNGDITEFSITTSSTSTSERTERIIGSNNYTNLTFANTGSTITKSGGTDFTTDGFLVGHKVIVDGTSLNDGVYTISDVAATVITVEETLTDETINPTYFGTGLYQTSVTPSAGRPTNFAFTLGTGNEVSADLGNDVFFIKRVGAGTGNVRFGINGVERYRITTAYTLEVGCGLTAHSGQQCGTFNDINLTYNKARRVVKIGNGTTTGAAHPNFKMIQYDTIDIPTSDWSLQIDGVEAVINTNPTVAPAAGEVTVLAGAGELWFNAADQTKSITGNWRTVFGIDPDA
jgi:hypothetical protein